MSIQSQTINLLQQVESIHGFVVLELHLNGEPKYEVSGPDGNLYFFKNQEIAVAFMAGVMYGQKAHQLYEIKPAELRKKGPFLGINYNGIFHVSGFLLIGFTNAQIS